MKTKSFISEDIARQIRQIEIYTRRLLSGSLVGDTRSAIKGTGYEFDQIREYSMGDDIRFIDWNASARMNNLLIKQYVEERSRTILFAVDVSKSEFYGSDCPKREITAQIASALALVASYGNDRVGLLLFSDEVELFIPPSRARYHVHEIMEKLFTFEPKHTNTNISSALSYLAKLKIRDGVVFLVSDFIDSTLSSHLSLVSKKYDLIAVRYLDSLEKKLPSVGFLTIEDIETGAEIELDMRKDGAQRIAHFLDDRVIEQNKLFRKHGVELLEITPEKPFIADIIRFFARRMRY